MLLFYIDEFGDHSMRTLEGDATRLKDGVSELFVLSAVGIRDSSRKPLAEHIFEIKRRHFGPEIESNPWGDSEIKGRHLRRAARSAAAGKKLTNPKAYECLNTPAKVNALIKELGLLFDSFRPLLFCMAVDKLKVLEKEKKYQMPPLGAAYAYLEQRVALTMERLHAGEGALLVADQQTQHEAYFRSGEMNSIRDKMTKKLSVQPNYNLVLDKPLWVDTHLSTWDREILQLADIAAYSAAEYLTRGEAPGEACYMWPQLKRQLAIQWTTGSVVSGGLAVYPKSSTRTGK